MICATAVGEKSPVDGQHREDRDGQGCPGEGAGRTAIAYCDAAMAKLTAANVTEEIKFFTGPTPRLGVFAFNNSHNMEHYGNMVTYMRLKGVVPPSSEGR